MFFFSFFRYKKATKYNFNMRHFKIFLTGLINQTISHTYTYINTIITYTHTHSSILFYKNIYQKRFLPFFLIQMCGFTGYCRSNKKHWRRRLSFGLSFGFLVLSTGMWICCSCKYIKKLYIAAAKRKQKKSKRISVHCGTWSLWEVSRNSLKRK